MQRVLHSMAVSLALATGSCRAGRVADPALSATATDSAWIVEAGTRVPQASAPATFRLADGSYRMYLPGLELRTSLDGLAWSAPQRIALSEPGEFLRNPALVQSADGGWIIIYEGVRDENLPSRATRFFRATSRDGVAFTKTPGALADGAVLVPAPADLGFISAPDLIALPDGSLRVYFNTADGLGAESARSSDGGLSWTREGRLTVAGLAADRRTADLDVIALSSGGYRLFFAAGDFGAPAPRIFSATSADGLHFTLDAGERLSPSDASLYRVDPDVVQIAPGKFRMYFGEASSGAGPFSIRSAQLGAR